MIYDKIYLCKQDDFLVAKFQEAVQGYLYFGAAKDEKMLPTFIIRSYDGNRTLRYTDWSDGQKTLFTSLLEINYIKPEILLIDEIETHYHPDYISQLLGFIKGTVDQQIVRQCIVVTHHPHVIFSKFVDKVNYIDTKDGKIKAPEQTFTIGKEFFKTYIAPRVIKELDTYEKKIESAYNLFEQKDRQILQLNSLCKGEGWDETLRKGLFKKVEDSGIDETLFLNFTEFMTLLSHRKYEKDYISPALVIKVVDGDEIESETEKNYINKDDKNISFQDCIKKIQERALKVNQEDQTFMVLQNENQYTLFPKNLENNEPNDNLQLYDPHPVQNLITDSGCAWVLPGDSSIQLYIKGEFLANYRNGEWKPRDFKFYEEKIKILAGEFNEEFTDLESVLLEAFKICLLASKKKYGMTLAIELKEKEIIDKCDDHYIKELDDSKGKEIKNLSDKDRKLYLKLIAGDGAAILDGNGYTRATNAIFQPNVKTKIEKDKLVKNGTRHLNAQKITKEAKEKAIIFVVSTDGPITLFHKGEAVFRVL